MKSHLLIIHLRIYLFNVHFKMSTMHKCGRHQEYRGKTQSRSSMDFQWSIEYSKIKQFKAVTFKKYGRSLYKAQYKVHR